MKNTIREATQEDYDDLTQEDLDNLIHEFSELLGEDGLDLVKSYVMARIKKGTKE